MRTKDEKLAHKYNIPYVETISVQGIGAFLRTVPVYEEIAELIKKHSSKAMVMNFANPAGPLVTYLHKKGIKNAIGICNNPMAYTSSIADIFRVSESSVSMDWKGLNHFAVADKIYINGENVLPSIVKKVRLGEYHLPFSYQLLEDVELGMSSYFQWYFHSDKKMQELQKQKLSRGEEAKKLEKELLNIYSQSNTIEMPELLKKEEVLNVRK